MLAAHLGEEFFDIEINLARGADVADLKTVGLEAILDEAGLLDRDPVLARIVDLETGRRCPDVPRMAEREVTALVHVTAGDEAQIDMRKHLDQSRARRLRHISDRGLRRLSIVGQIEKQWLVQEQRDRPAVRARDLRDQPVELLRLESEP